MTTPEEFEKLVHRLHEKAFHAKDGLTGSYGEEYDAVLSTYRAAWENRVPELAKTIKCYSSDLPNGELVIFRGLSGRWAIVREDPDEDIKAKTPALALEAWRKENNNHE